MALTTRSLCVSTTALRYRSRMLCWLVLAFALCAAIGCIEVTAARGSSSIVSVSVGDPDAHRRDLLSAATGSGSGGGTCPNATTLAVVPSSTAESVSSVRVTNSADCKSVVVKSAGVDKRVALDVRNRGVVVVQSLPTDIESLQLGSNSIATLVNVTLPSKLVSLDVSSNALTTLANVSFPTTLTHLNVSRNPLATLETVKLPSSLLQLDVTRAKLTAFERIVLPSSLTSLNVSGNAIVRVAGVAFPRSLAALSLRSLGPVATTTTDGSSPAPQQQQDTLLDEFEVRQSDATRFATFTATAFDVAPIARATCSDTRAKRVYVHNTMLCVVPDTVFALKYDYDDTNVSTDGSRNRTTAAPRPALDETFDQSRSWFLLASAVALSSVIVCIGAGALCRAGGRRIGCGRQRSPSKQQQLLRRSNIGAVHDNDDDASDDDDDDDDDKHDRKQRLRTA